MKLKLSPPSDNLIRSIPFGVIGGAICGSVIWSFTSLIGHSGTTGSEYVGAWELADVFLGMMYGGYFGIIMGPLGYVIFLRNIGLRKAILPASVGTIAGGCLGAFNDILTALYYGCIGYLLSLSVLWFVVHLKNRLKANKQT
ncbi:MAG: hypothetical protein AB1306_07825 [Nitrospirota bacterium]